MNSIEGGYRIPPVTPTEPSSAPGEQKHEPPVPEINPPKDQEELAEPQTPAEEAGHLDTYA